MEETSSNNPSTLLKIHQRRRRVNPGTSSETVQQASNETSNGGGLYQGSVTLVHDDMSPNDFNYTQSQLLSGLTSPPSQHQFQLNTMKLLENYDQIMNIEDYQEEECDENHNESLEELVTNNNSIGMMGRMNDAENEISFMHS
jgi:hypothetical protein